ncbi:MAG: hypothetical protein AAB669_04060 [Patescibacteria group bacterium]
MRNRQMMMTILGLLLGAFGLVLLNFGNAPTSSTAADPYSSTWKATQLYRLRHTNNSNQVTSANAIGVAEWQVTGNIGETNYSETWKGPAADSVNIQKNPGTGNICRGTYDPSKWLAGCIDSSYNRFGSFKYDLILTSPSDSSLLSEGIMGGTNTTNWSGRSVKCNSGFGGLPGCLSAIGSYGFYHFIPKESALNASLDLQIGMMMPLEWTVTGSIE